MKLHLPKKLRFALLSTVIAVSAATPSFAAITPWAIESWSGYNETAQSVTVGSGNVVSVGVANQNWDANWSFVFTVDAASLKENSIEKTLTLLGVKLKSDDATNPATYLAAGATMSNAANNLALATHGQASKGGAITIPDSGDLTFVLSRNGSASGNISLKVYNDASTPALIINGSNAQNYDTFYLSGVTFGGKGSAATGSNSTANIPNDDRVGSYIIKKAGYSLGTAATDTDVAAFNGAKILTWNGGTSGNWSEASWSMTGATEQQSFTDSDSAIFATENATVALTSATSASTAVIHANTTFNLDGNELTVGSVAIDGGKTLHLEGSGGKLIVGNFTLEAGATGVGTVSAGEGTAVELTGGALVNTTIEGKFMLTPFL